MASLTDMHDLAVEVLAACEDALNSIPLAAPGYAGVPPISFVSPSVPALDCCDSLMVYTRPISEGATDKGGIAASGNWINRVAYTILIGRCVPVPDPKTMEPPTPAAQQDAAAQIHYDAWSIWNHLHNLVAAGALFERCGDVIWGQLVALPASGGCAGSQVTVTVSLDGYQTAVGT